MTDRLVDQIAAEPQDSLLIAGLEAAAVTPEAFDMPALLRHAAKELRASLPALARVDQMREALGALICQIEAAHLSGDHDFNALRYSVPFEDAAELLALPARFDGDV